MITYSASQTHALGKLFSHSLKEKDVVVLSGALGGGKTTFVRGIVGGFGYRGPIRSPSFTLVREYPFSWGSIYHIDLYRLTHKEIVALGIEDYLYAERSVTLIEWGEKISSDLPSYIKVEFFFRTEKCRSIQLSFKGYEKRRQVSLTRHTDTKWKKKEKK